MMNYLNLGISFNGLHSLRDYGLFISEPPDFGSPEPKRYTVDIPGRDGDLDYTTSATGEVKYNNRQMKFVFATMIAPEFREALKSRLLSDLHGRSVTVVYDLDADWYYTGIAEVDFDDVESWKMKVVITVDAYPYKLEDGHTIITVEPTSFSAETIFLGKGTEAQHANSIFEFGTRSNPQLDLTEFSALLFKWRGSPHINEPMLQIVDGDGHVFNTDLEANELSDYQAMRLLTSEIDGITLSRVYRILCQGRSLVELYGITTASATTIVTVDRMTVVPIWTASDACTVFINGAKFSLLEGANQDFNCRLREGENQVSFITDSEDTTIELSFQNGRL